MNDELYLRASAYLDGELSPDERAAAERDPATMELVGELAVLQARLYDIRPDHTDRDQRIMAAIQTARAEAEAPRDPADIEELADQGQPAAAAPPISPPATAPGQPHLELVHSGPPSPQPTRTQTRAHGVPSRTNRWLAIAAGIIGVGLFAVVVSNLPGRGTGANNAAIESSDSSAGAADGAGFGARTDGASEDGVEPGADDGGIPQVPTDQDGQGGAERMSALWGSPPLLEGTDDLEPFLDDLLAFEPPESVEAPNLGCTPINDEGDEVLPVALVKFKQSPRHPIVDAVVAVYLRSADEPPSLTVYAIDPGTCDVLTSSTATWEPGTLSSGTLQPGASAPGDG